jgi:hypothetical protein
MAAAKEAATAETDADVGAIMVKHDYDFEGEAPTTEEIKQFREEELPALKEAAEGKTTRAEFDEAFNAFRNSWGFNFMLLKECVSGWTLLWLGLGVSTAFKIGTSGHEG